MNDNICYLSHKKKQFKIEWSSGMDSLKQQLREQGLATCENSNTNLQYMVDALNILLTFEVIGVSAWRNGIKRISEDLGGHVFEIDKTNTQPSLE